MIDGAAQTVAVFLSAAGCWLPPVSTAVGNAPTTLAVVDVGGTQGGPDGWADVVVVNEMSGDISLLLGDGAGNLAPQLRLRASNGLYGLSQSSDTGSFEVRSRSHPIGIAHGDFNEDAAPDLVLTNCGLNAFSMLLGKSSGGFANPVSFLTGSGPTEVRAADFDRDGHLDLAILNETDDTITIFLGNGRGGFPDSFTADAGNLPSGLTIDDVDGDGNLDLLVGNDLGDLLILAGRGDGTFESFYRAGRHTALAVADFNGDGQEDTVVVNETSDTLTVWLAHGQRREKHFTLGRKDGLAAPERST